MIKVVEFFDSGSDALDEQINKFLDKSKGSFIDIKYSSFLDPSNETYVSSALLIYNAPTSEPELPNKSSVSQEPEN